jgi:hypothetical protein
MPDEGYKFEKYNLRVALASETNDLDRMGLNLEKE